VVAREEHRLPVRRKGGPAKLPGIHLVVFEQRHARGGDVVLEVERLVAGRRCSPAAAATAGALLRLRILIPAAAAPLRRVALLVCRDVARLDRVDAGRRRDLEIELERGVLLDESDGAERQILGVVGKARDGGQRGGYFA
jgi:hypothetical protein